MSTPHVTRTREQLSDVLGEVDAQTAVVMTLGALHDGHRALMRAGRDLVGEDGVVIVTIFVNPLQFGAGEDFERYPRTADADLAACAEEGVDVVFAPGTEVMYPGGTAQVSVDAGPLGQELEGAARPTHFSGVLTVVAKLLNLTVPTFAVFGEKDYQQLALVRRMVDDLEMPYEVVGVPTVREDDGVALSSRNRYLSGDERAAATILARALAAGQAAGPDGPEAVKLAAHAVFLEAGIACPTEGLGSAGADAPVAGAGDTVAVSYLALRGPDLAPNPEHGEARLLVAARVGSTRLLDNVAVTLPD